MKFAAWFLAFMAPATLPAMALAGDIGPFAGIDLYAGGAFGSSGTSDGGAPFAGGSIIDNVTFGSASGIGGHVGYRFGGPFSVSIGYQHIGGGISWDARFPLLGESSAFSGSAISDVLLGTLVYELPLSGAVTAKATAGLGMTLNTLSGIAETDGATGTFLADVADHSELSPVAQIGAGIQYAMSPNATLGLDALAAYTGGFATGRTRSGNAGITDINPYRIDDVWRAGLSASLQFQF